MDVLKENKMSSEQIGCVGLVNCRKLALDPDEQKVNLETRDHHVNCDGHMETMADDEVDDTDAIIQALDAVYGTGEAGQNSSAMDSRIGPCDTGVVFERDKVDVKSGEASLSMDCAGDDSKRYDLSSTDGAGAGDGHDTTAACSDSEDVSAHSNSVAYEHSSSYSSSISDSLLNENCDTLTKVRPLSLDEQEVNPLDEDMEKPSRELHTSPMASLCSDNADRKSPVNVFEDISDTNDKGFSSTNCSEHSRDATSPKSVSQSFVGISNDKDKIGSTSDISDEPLSVSQHITPADDCSMEDDRTNQDVDSYSDSEMSKSERPLSADGAGVCADDLGENSTSLSPLSQRSDDDGIQSKDVIGSLDDTSIMDTEQDDECQKESIHSPDPSLKSSGSPEAVAISSSSKAVSGDKMLDCVLNEKIHDGFDHECAKLEDTAINNETGKGSLDCQEENDELLLRTKDDIESNKNIGIYHAQEYTNRVGLNIDSSVRFENWCDKNSRESDRKRPASDGDEALISVLESKRSRLDDDYSEASNSFDSGSQSLSTHVTGSKTVASEHECVTRDDSSVWVGNCVPDTAVKHIGCDKHSKSECSSSDEDYSIPRVSKSKRMRLNSDYTDTEPTKSDSLNVGSDKAPQIESDNVLDDASIRSELNMPESECVQSECDGNIGEESIRLESYHALNQVTDKSLKSETDHEAGDKSLKTECNIDDLDDNSVISELDQDFVDRSVGSDSEQNIGFKSAKSESGNDNVEDVKVEVSQDIVDEGAKSEGDYNNEDKTDNLKTDLDSTDNSVTSEKHVDEDIDENSVKSNIDHDIDENSVKSNIDHDIGDNSVRSEIDHNSGENKSEIGRDSGDKSEIHHDIVDNNVISEIDPDLGDDNVKLEIDVDENFGEDSFRSDSDENNVKLELEIEDISDNSNDSANSDMDQYDCNQSDKADIGQGIDTNRVSPGVTQDVGENSVKSDIDENICHDVDNATSEIGQDISEYSDNAEPELSQDIDNAKPEIGQDISEYSDNAEPELSQDIDNAKPELGQDNDDKAVLEIGHGIDDNAQPGIGQDISDNAKPQIGQHIDDNDDDIDDNAELEIGHDISDNVEPEIGHDISDNAEPELVQDISDSVEPEIGQAIDVSAKPEIVQDISESVEPEIGQAIDVSAKPEIVQDISESVEPEIGQTIDDNAEPELVQDISDSVDPEIDQAIDVSAKPEIGQDISDNAEPEIGHDISDNAEPELGQDISDRVEPEIGQTIDVNAKPEIGQDISDSVDPEIDQEINDNAESEIGQDIHDSVEPEIGQVIDDNAKPEIVQDISDNVEPEKGHNISDNAEPELGQDISDSVKPEIGQVIDVNAKPEIGQDISDNVEPEISQDISDNVEPEIGKAINDNVKPEIGQDISDNAKPEIGQDIENNAASEIGQNISDNVKPEISQVFDDNSKQEIGQEIETNATSEINQDIDDNANSEMGLSITDNAESVIGQAIKVKCSSDTGVKSESDRRNDLVMDKVVNESDDQSDGSDHSDGEGSIEMKSDLEEADKSESENTGNDGDKSAASNTSCSKHSRLDLMINKLGSHIGLEPDKVSGLDVAGASDSGDDSNKDMISETVSDHEADDDDDEMKSSLSSQEVSAGKDDDDDNKSVASPASVDDDDVMNDDDDDKDLDKDPKSVTNLDDSDVDNKSMSSSKYMDEDKILDDAPSAADDNSNNTPVPSPTTTTKPQTKVNEIQPVPSPDNISQNSLDEPVREQSSTNLNNCARRKSQDSLDESVREQSSFNLNNCALSSRRKSQDSLDEPVREQSSSNLNNCALSSRRKSQDSLDEIKYTASPDNKSVTSVEEVKSITASLDGKLFSVSATPSPALVASPPATHINEQDLENMIRQRVMKLLEAEHQRITEQYTSKIKELQASNDIWKTQARELQRSVHELSSMVQRHEKRRATIMKLNVQRRNVCIQVDDTTNMSKPAASPAKSPLKATLPPPPTAKLEQPHTAAAAATSLAPIASIRLAQANTGVIGAVASQALANLTNFSTTKVVNTTAASLVALQPIMTTGIPITIQTSKGSIMQTVPIQQSPVMASSLTRQTVRSMLRAPLTTAVVRSAPNALPRFRAPVIGAPVISPQTRPGGKVVRPAVPVSNFVNTSLKVIDLTADEETGGAKSAVLVTGALPNTPGQQQFVRMPVGTRLLVNTPAGTHLVPTQSIGSQANNVIFAPGINASDMPPGSVLTVLQQQQPGSTHIVRTVASTTVASSTGAHIPTSQLHTVASVTFPGQAKSGGIFKAGSVLSTPPPLITVPAKPAPIVFSTMQPQAVAPPVAKHPAALPHTTVNPPTRPGMKALPPKPSLKISIQGSGIVLSWNMVVMAQHEAITNYQLFAYQETTAPPHTNLWKKVGDVTALPLPMACTLTQFQEGNKYHFAVRALDVHGRLGPFSDPSSIHLFHQKT